MWLKYKIKKIQEIGTYSTYLLVAVILLKFCFVDLSARLYIRGELIKAGPGAHYIIYTKLYVFGRIFRIDWHAATLQSSSPCPQAEYAPPAAIKRDWCII